MTEPVLNGARFAGAHPREAYPHNPEGDLLAMTGQGSSGNVIAAVCSFFIPGLGQLVQGRLLAAALQFVFAAVLWWVLLGWIVHIWSIVDAARWKVR